MSLNKVQNEEEIDEDDEVKKLLREVGVHNETSAPSRSPAYPGNEASHHPFPRNSQRSASRGYCLLFSASNVRFCSLAPLEEEADRRGDCDEKLAKAKNL